MQVSSVLYPQLRVTMIPDKLIRPCLDNTLPTGFNTLNKVLPTFTAMGKACHHNYKYGPGNDTQYLLSDVSPLLKGFIQFIR